jgi:hypothetical protein
MVCLPLGRTAESRSRMKRARTRHVEWMLGSSETEPSPMAWPPGEGGIRGATSQGKEERCDGNNYHLYLIAYNHTDSTVYG